MRGDSLCLTGGKCEESGELNANICDFFPLFWKLYGFMFAIRMFLIFEKLIPLSRLREVKVCFQSLLLKKYVSKVYF